MTEEVSRQTCKRPQFSLWVLLFVVPTIAGMIFAVYSTFAAQEKRYRDLIAEEATLYQESKITEIRLGNLRRMMEAHHHRQEEWRKPESVLFYIKHMDLISQGERGSSGVSLLRLPTINDAIYSFTQANDEQLLDLVDLLIEQYPQLEVSIQYRVLECLKNLPAYVRRKRLESVRGKVVEFLEPLKDDPEEAIATQARDTLQAYARAD